MSRKKIFQYLLLIQLCIIQCQITAQSFYQQKDAIKNLVTFTKLYGYVRFFHPSDEAANLDWNKFAVLGAEEILKCNNDVECVDILKKLFYPIAPGIKIYSRNKKEINSVDYIRDTAGIGQIAWQHYGVWLTNESTPYRSMRVYESANVSMNVDNSKPFKIPEKPQNYKLFDKCPKPGEFIRAVINDSLIFEIPLTVYSDSLGTLEKNREYPFQILNDKLSLVDIKYSNGDDPRIRLACVIISWNILQHFYPYSDLISTCWENVLEEVLSDAFNDKSRFDFSVTLRKMLSKLEDGHAMVQSFASTKNAAGIPIKIDLIENRVIVTNSKDSLFKKGDEITHLEGKPVLTFLKEVAECVSGSEQYKLYGALKELFNGLLNSTICINYVRDNVTGVMNYKRQPLYSKVFYDLQYEYSYSPIIKFDNDIFYINKNSVTLKMFEDSLVSLSKAKGIIIDIRSNILSKDTKSTTLMNIFILMRHLSSQPIKGCRMLIPKIVYPDRKNISWDESSHLFPPAEPKLKGKLVLIIDASVISSYESFVAPISYYQLADIVGSQSGGINGNVNFITLPGGYKIKWTGMRVLSPDGSQLFLNGVKPNYPVHRSIKAIKEGRDECLDKALEILKNAN